MTISLPAFLKATPASLQLVTAFYAAHRYQQQSIRVHRVPPSRRSSRRPTTRRAWTPKAWPS